MRTSISLRSGVVTLIASALVLVGATPASALGNKTLNCAWYDQTTGSSTAQMGGFTTSSNGNCGTASVRLVYGARGEPQRFYTGWSYDPSVATIGHPGQGLLVYGGHNSVSKPAGLFTQNRNYST